MRMARPLTRNQRLENAAFLKALRRTGNVRLAARECGLSYGTMQHRRSRHPAFAQRWAAAVVFANARLAKTGPLRPAGPSASPAGGGGSGGGGPSDAAFRTKGGEPVVVLLKNGRLQMRRAQPGKLTRQAEQAFLLALSATANMSLAAASVGVAQAAFHRRKRRNPAFAREVLAALAQGYEQVEAALLESFSPADVEATAWRDNAPPALPPMTAAQALQLLFLHHKQVRWREAELRRALLPGETGDQRSAKLARLYRATLAEEAEGAGLARRRDEPPGPHEPPPIVLPDLAQVTGWSAADPAKGGPDGAWGDRALFGGWRIEHMEAQAKAVRDAALAEAARAAAEARAEVERGWDAVAARIEAGKAARRAKGGRGRGRKGLSRSG